MQIIVNKKHILNTLCMGQSRKQFFFIYGPHRALALLATLAAIPLAIIYPTWHHVIIGFCIITGIVSFGPTEYPDRQSNKLNDPLSWLLRIAGVALSGVVVMGITGYNAYQVFYHAYNVNRYFFPWFFAFLISGGIGLTYGWCAVYHWSIKSTDGNPFD